MSSPLLRALYLNSGSLFFAFLGGFLHRLFCRYQTIRLAYLRGKHDTLPTQSDLETLIDFTKPQSLACVF